MLELKKILVGVDQLQSREGEFSPPVAEAVKQALWLAERLSAEITFFTAIDLPEQEELYTPLGEHEHLVGQVEISAHAGLDRLVAQARLRGVPASGQTAVGEGWVELTRAAMDGAYDLVIVGTREQGAVRRALFGSTSMKLVHNCPVPVWVAKPEPHAAPASLLIASDFSEVSDRALRLALGIASACQAQVHLIHVLEYPFARLWESGLLEARREEFYHDQDRVAAEGRLNEQLARISVQPTVNVQRAVVEGAVVADDAIAKYIAAHQIDLLIAGTSARRGLAGAFLGNTAERLLTTIHCSLLAIKPADFVCPVPFESFQYAHL